MMTFVAVAAALTLVSGPAQAATTRTVTDPGNAGPGTLRATLPLSLPGDTILVPGSFTITLASPLSVAQLAPAGVTIAATGGGVPTITGANATGLFAQGSGTALTLDGLSLINGNAGGDGNMIFSGSNAFLTIKNSNVSGNGSSGATGNGGAVHMDSTGNLTVQNSTVANNHGGSATGNGGAVQMDAPSTTNITDSTFADNKGGPATGNGGAIQVNSPGTLNVSGSTFSGNTAGGGGGAILLNSNVTANITNSTFFNNSTDGVQGGAVQFNSPASGLLLNTTIFNNHAESGQGGGINVNSDPLDDLRVKNSIISGNTAGTGGNCGGSTQAQASLGHNLENGTSCGFNSAGDLNADPLLAALGSNGGSTATLALPANSIAVDSGDNSGCPATDQRGQARPVNGNTGRGTVCDIGAFEYVPPAAPADTVNPVASALKLAPSSFGALSSGGSVIAAKKKRKVAKGTTVSYKLSEAATSVFTVERKAKGRKKGKKCVSGRKKGKRCTKFKLLGGSFTHKGAAGSNSFKFSGRLAGKKLKPGSYRLTAIPTDAAGNHGKAVTASFKIAR